MAGTIYTQGPWQLVPSGTGKLCIAGGRAPDPVTRARYLWVATVHPGPGAEVRAQHPGWEWQTPEETAANARLVVESPVLLENCQAALALLTDDGTQGGTAWTVGRLRRSIARVLDQEYQGVRPS